MSDADLIYKGSMDPDELKVGECSIRRVSRWRQDALPDEKSVELDGVPVSTGWNLWFCLAFDKLRRHLAPHDGSHRCSEWGAVAMSKSQVDLTSPSLLAFEA